MVSCESCDSTYQTERSLIRYHYYDNPDHAPDSWVDCESCSKVFKALKDMRIHHNREHGESIAHTERCENENCDEVFKAKPSHDARFCSPDCWYEYKERETNTDWYNSAKHKQFREDVFERDDYTCQDCGSDGSESHLNAHHIESRSSSPEKQSDADNGITLCVSCHADRHEEAGEKEVARLIRSKHVL